MRLKAGDGPLQAVHNGNNDILNSPKRINTIQNSNYTQNTQNLTLYSNVTTNEITNITKNIQQLTIEDVAALNNVHNNTQELRWCNSDLTTTGGHDQQQLNYQRQLALTSLANNRLNINSNLAARLRLRAQNAQHVPPPTYTECQTPQSPDDIPIDEDEAHQSGNSSVSVSPQDEDRAFDPSDSAESSDEGNDYSRPKSTDIRPHSLKGFVNPNYPGFQHLAHTLDFDDETLNNANNNNEEFEVADKFDSVNRLDSVENIQKVFHDKSLDIDVARVFPSASETDQDSPNGSSSANCDSESESCGPGDGSTSNDESGGTVNENFNIRTDEKKVFVNECSGDDVALNTNDIKQREIAKLDDDIDSGIATVYSGTPVVELSESETVSDNSHVTHEEKCIGSVVEDFRKEIEDELGRVYAKEHFEDPYEPRLVKSTEAELEIAVEKLQFLNNIQPAAANYLIQPNTDFPFGKDSSPTTTDQTMVFKDTKLISHISFSAEDNMMVSEQANTKFKSDSVNICQSMEVDELKVSRRSDTSESLASEIYSRINENATEFNPTETMSDLSIYSFEPQNHTSCKNKLVEVENQNTVIQERTTRKPVPSFLPLNQKDLQETSKKVLSPIENKMADATLSSCQEHISKIVVERPNLPLQQKHGAYKKSVVDTKTLSFNKMEVDGKALDEDSKIMEVDNPLPMDLGRRDSNRELEEIEIQIKKIKSDTMCNMEEVERFRKEDITKGFKERDEDSVVLRRNPPKMNTYVKKRRDYSQQFGSLITFPKRDPTKRDPLNRRSVPMARDRKKIGSSEYLGGFDVYNIETAMPKIDLEAIECHLRATREEERRLPVGKETKQVCQKFFSAAMKLPKSRIVRVSKILLNGGVPEERRGGDRVSKAFEETKDSIRNFIKNLKGTESHYSRQHTKRIYLSAELSIRKLHKMYNSSASQQLKSTYTMFHKIFVTQFNIGFRGPAADVCSYCTRLKHKIKNEKNEKEKVKAITEKRIHQLRSKAFYELLKMNSNNAITFCFDMQQVQPLPKTPVGEAFYLRQISYYTFCCIKTGVSLKPQFYTWTEDQASRGCIEVASALLHYIRNLEVGPEITTLRLFCDGCGGQNKNSHVVHTLLFWLQQSESNNIQKIELHFPVRGHSFLPADRAFGVVERKLRKVSTISVKEDYHAIYQEVGDINILGNNWKVFDVKELQKVYKKVEKINDYKRITLTKTGKKNITEIECFPHYKSNLGSNKQNLLKRGKSVKDFVLPEAQLIHEVNPKKLANIKTLLEVQFGANWQENPKLNWYKNLLLTQTTNNVEENESEQDEERDQTQDQEVCECLEEESTLHI